MRNSASDLAAREEQLDEIVASFLESVESGAAPDRRALLETHPDLAAELAAFFADHDRLKTLADPLRQLALAVDEALVAPPEGSDFGEFDLLREIARGGMGVVYEARHRILNRRVALKLVLSGRFAAPDDLRRFQVEAEAAAQLDHPNIVPILDVGEERGVPYFSMKLLEGGSLAERLDRYRADPLAAARLVATIARAVHHAHQRGVLHRDLKPSNILFDAADQPHVADFGLAKRLDAGDDATRTGAMLGSPPYMAPEQVSGAKRATTTATDVHGLGAILHALLTGSPPFQAATLAELVVLVRDHDPEPPSARNRRVDLDLQTICLKCLEKAPSRRYGSALTVAEELDRWLEGRPIQARPAGRVERLGRWARRNPLVAGLTTLVGLLIATVGVGLVVGIILIGREAESLRRQLYSNRVNLAQREWSANNIGLAERLLDECPADLRGWEWRHVRRVAHPNRLDFRGHTKRIIGLTFAQGGAKVLSAAANRDKPPPNGELLLWEAASGNLVRARKLPACTSLAIMEDGATAAIGMGEGGISIVDLATGKADVNWNLPGAVVTALAPHPDGRRLASWHQRDWPVYAAVIIWDRATGRRLQTIAEGVDLPRLTSLTSAVRFAFSPDGKWLAAAEDAATIRIWNVESGAEVHTLRGHRGRIYALAFSPDGTRLVSGGFDREVRVWDPATGAALQTLSGHTSFVRCLAFSPDGAILASGGEDNVIRLWELPSGREAGLLRGHRDFVLTLAFSADSRALLSGSEDGEIKRWDLEHEPQLHPMRHEGWVKSVAFSPDGRTLVSAGYDGSVGIWDPLTGRSLRRLLGHNQMVNAAALSRDGRLIASAGHDKAVRLWRAETGELLRAHETREYALCVALSPDGSRLAAGDGSGALYVWDTASGRQVVQVPAHAEYIAAMAFHPDGRGLITAGGDRKLRQWNASSWRVTRTFPCQGFSNSMKAGMLAFSADGTRLAVANDSDTRKAGAVTVWDFERGRELLRFSGHVMMVCAVAFSPDGARLATGSLDQTIKIWDASTGQELLTLRGHGGGVLSLAFDPDGRRLASGGIDNHVRTWDAPRSGAAAP